jgi:hypothetical protein
VQIRIFDDRLNNIGGDFAQGLGRRSNRNCAAQSAGDGADRRDMIKEILACPGLLQWRPVTGDDQQSIMFGLETHRLDDGVLAARLQYRFTEILLAIVAHDDRENVMGRWSGGARQFVFTIAHIASLLGSSSGIRRFNRDENKYGTKRTLVKVRR